MDIAGIKIDPLTREVSFQFQSKPLYGFDILIQLVILTLLTSLGSDVLDYIYGGGLTDVVGKYNMDPADLSEIQSEVSRIISKTDEDIISNQVGLDIPIEERLRKLTLLSLTPNIEVGILAVKIRIENEAGRTRDVVL